MSTTQIIRFFIQYRYAAIFPIAIIEGPIISIISGFLISQGALSLIPALFVVFIGDVLSDIIFYLIGRSWRRSSTYFVFLKISDKRLLEIEGRYSRHPWKTMIIGKVSYGLGMLFMIASGASKMSLKDFLLYCFSLNFLRSSFFIAIGYYFGKGALLVAPKYFEYYAFSIIILIPTLYLIFRKKIPNK